MELDVGLKTPSEEIVGEMDNPNSYWCQPDNAKAYNFEAETSLEKDAYKDVQDNGAEIIYMELIKNLVRQLNAARREVKDLRQKVYLHKGVSTFEHAEDLREINEFLHQENKDLRWQFQQRKQDHHKQLTFKREEASPQITRLFSEDLNEINFKSAKSKQLKDINNFKCCQFCGTEHWWGAEFCPAYGSTCGNCQMRNHFTNVCKKDKRLKAKSKAKTSDITQKKVLENDKENTNDYANTINQQSKAESVKNAVKHNRSDEIIRTESYETLRDTEESSSLKNSLDQVVTMDAENAVKSKCSTHKGLLQKEYIKGETELCSEEYQDINKIAVPLIIRSASKETSDVKKPQIKISKNNDNISYTERVKRKFIEVYSYWKTDKASASDTDEINATRNQNPIENQKCASKGCEMAGINNPETEFMVNFIQESKIKKSMPRDEENANLIESNKRSVSACDREILSINRKSFNVNKKELCNYCGEIHILESRFCPAYGKVCRNCKKLNHIAKVCRSSQGSKRFYPDATVGFATNRFGETDKMVVYHEKAKFKEYLTCSQNPTTSEVCELLRDANNELPRKVQFIFRIHKYEILCKQLAEDLRQKNVEVVLRKLPPTKMVRNQSSKSCINESCKDFMNSDSKDEVMIASITAREPSLDTNNMRSLKVDEDFKGKSKTQIIPEPVINDETTDFGECGHCGKSTSLKCTRCKWTYYCNRDHQHKDWKKHNSICKKLSRISRELMLMKTLIATERTEELENYKEEFQDHIRLYCEMERHKRSMEKQDFQVLDDEVDKMIISEMSNRKGKERGKDKEMEIMINTINKEKHWWGTDCCATAMNVKELRI